MTPTPQSPPPSAGRWLVNQARSARAWTLWSAGLGFAGGALVIAQAALLARIVYGAVVLGLAREELRVFFWGAAGVVVARAALAWAREAAGFRAGAQVRETVRAALTAHLAALGPLYAAARPSGALASTAVENVEALHDFFARFLPQLALAATIPAAILWVVFPLSWAAGGLLLFSAPLIPLFTALIGMGAESISQRHFQSLARMSAHFLDVLQGLGTLKLFGRSRDEAERVGRVSADFRRRTMGVLRVAFLSSAVLEFLSCISIALVAVYLGVGFLGYVDFGTYGRPLTLESGLFILLLAPEFYQPLRELGACYHARADAVGAAREILKVLAESPPGAGGGGKSGVGGGPARIRFDGVRLAYAGGRRAALEGVSFEVGAGERVVLAGPSGGGKTSIFNLLLRFCSPEGGRILVDDIPIEFIEPGTWRRRLAWIGQEPVLFEGTVRENIRLGRPGASASEIETAARQAGVEDVARRLPRGLDTPVGEGGLGLSRGQAQRVALARAFLKDAPILLLDEPTASLDPENEALVMAAIERLSRGRTVILATHRLAHVRHAERILVVAEGRIAEQGTCRELMAAGGMFRHLAAPRAQAETHA